MAQQEHLEWTYDDKAPAGPKEWSKLFRTGKHQSPINILFDGNCLSLPTATCCVESKLGSLLIGGSERNKQRVHRRLHLNSTGDDGPQSGRQSSASGGSLSRSSPTQASGSDYEDEEASSGAEEGPIDDANNNLFRHLHRKTCPQQPLKSHQMQHQNTRLCLSNKKIFLGYPRYLSSLQLTNTGHAWQVTLPPELTVHTLINGPPLADREYRLAQFHCHWGNDCDHGSEHQVNGKGFAAEIHFVHWNCTDFKTVDEASRHKHGLAVLAVLVQAIEGEQNRNKHLDKIIGGLAKIHKAGSSVAINNARLDLKKLFPTNRWLYASYEGSLTTPPLSEVVDWVVFLNPISCSTSQIEQFRKIRCSSNGSQHLTNNCRPVQPVHDRVVSIWARQ